MPNDTAFSVNELVRGVGELLTRIWPGYTCFLDACPEPSGDRSIDRAPFYVVYANSGAYGPNEGQSRQSASSCTVDVILQIRTAETEGTDAAWAVRTLRDRIDEFGRELYLPANGIVCGARPGALSWEIPAEQPRPVWQARITVQFEILSAARENGDFLV